MTNKKNPTVTVERRVSYSELTQDEKIEIAVTTEREDLLEAIAQDSLECVRHALVDRVREIPDKILTDILLVSEDEYVAQKAKEIVLKRKLRSDYPDGEFYKKTAAFLSKFFSKEFIFDLEKDENIRMAIAAIYLYYIKYGSYVPNEQPRGGNRLIFDSNFKPLYKFMNRYLGIECVILGVKVEDEPWSIELWKMIKKLAYYRYFPKELDSNEQILSKEVLNNIDTLKKHVFSSEIKRVHIKKSGISWIRLLAITLFRLGEPSLQEDKREVMRYELTIKEGEKVINKVETLLRTIYKTSAILTYYTDILD